MRESLKAACCIVMMLMPFGHGAITFGHIDNFNDGTERNWKNNASNIANAGPSGQLGDHALSLTASGLSGSGSRMLIFNNSTAWRGDYLAEGISSIAGDFRNQSNTPLNMRVAISNVGGNPLVQPSITHFVSSTPLILPPNSDWQTLIFPLDVSSLIRVSGASNYLDVISSVFEVRIFSSSTPSYRGDAIAGELLIDNIRAIPEPNSFMALLLGFLALYRIRRSR